MYTLAMKVKVHRFKQQEFLQFFSSFQGDEESKEEAMNLSLIEDAEDRTSYELISRWKTEECLERHLRGETFKVLLGALQVLCEKSVVQEKYIPEKFMHHLEPMLNRAN